jgi:hypothetical protein
MLSQPTCVRQFRQNPKIYPNSLEINLDFRGMSADFNFSLLGEFYLAS